MDAPPPPYTETTTGSSTVIPNVRFAGHNRTGLLASSHEGSETVVRALQISANEYFDSRPLAVPHPSETTICYLNIDPGAPRHNVPFPLPEQDLLNRDVTIQDWFTFVNHLYPQNSDDASTPNPAIDLGSLTEKKPRKSSSINRKPLPASASSLSRTTSNQSQDIDERSVIIDAVITHWNEGFFVPRGIQIARERRSGNDACNGAADLEGSLAARVQQGVNIFLDKRNLRVPSPSEKAPEITYAAEPEAIFPTRRPSDDAPLPVNGPTVVQATPRPRTSSSSQQPTTTSEDASTAAKGKKPLSKLSLRSKDEDKFPSGTDPQEIALYKAVAKGDKNMTKILLQSGVSPDICDKDGASALYRCVARGDSSIVKLLIEYFLDPNTRTITGDFPLYRAVSRGDSSVVRFLLMLKVDVNARNAKGKTPLVKAVQRGDSSIVQMLLDRDADPRAECGGVTPLSLAATKGDGKIAKLMLKNQEKATGASWAR